jgi:hypothetical protein
MLAGTALGYHPIPEDAKQSIHSMCDLDYWAWSRVEIKINGWGRDSSAVPGGN